MKKLSKALFATASALAFALLGGCSTINTPSDMVGLHYDGGWMTASKFLECVPASKYQNTPPGHTSYQYPTSLRYYNASIDKGAESGPITVVSKDNAEMLVPVSVTFTLITGDCEKLRSFHEKIANRDQAFWGGTDFADENADHTPDGWVKILNTYIGKALDTTLDRAAQAHPWRALWNDPAVKVQLEKEVESNLTKMVDDRMGDHYFEIHTILVQKPDPVSVDLKNAASAEQVAVAKAKAAEVEAAAQEKAASARVKAAKAEREVEVTKAQTEAAVIAEQIRVMGKEAWIKKYGIDKGLTPWPSPVVAGSNPK